MKFPLFSFFGLLVLGGSLAVSTMPKVVQEFEKMHALWNTLDERSHLPGNLFFPLNLHPAKGKFEMLIIPLPRRLSIVSSKTMAKMP
ncbi:uncharacterized protein MEPE_02952 [Melanopsichium pennsylvanicum]|uniref:Uncharacterized protein n=1 Tax=Melanopsichium pennsylvanicum TaxID=63383 RepID=A0AAJ4XKX2_9BASI|nr:uncharacterized protein MEPE_02952 [Melanopsichium pennsylvanicum]